MMARRVLALAVLAAGCADEGSVATRPAVDTFDVERFDDLTSLAVGKVLPSAIRTIRIAQLRAGLITVDSVIDELLRDPGFSRDVVSHVILGWLDFGPYSYIVAPLTKKEVDGVNVHFIARSGATGCTPSEAVDVAPWWNLKTSIKVCPDDYQPAKFKAANGDLCTGVSGLTAKLDGHWECGCGPNLINCTGDVSGTSKSLHQETVRTLAHVVENDLPFKEALTTQHSFRDRTAAYLYQRDAAYQGRLAQVQDLSSWPTDGQWAPREEDWPGAHSGILTNRQLLYMTDGPRDRMRLFFERFWCKVPTSFGVEVETFRELVHGAADLRKSGARWEQLAAQPGCGTCHARMDYGMQFFTGYPPQFTGCTANPQASRHAESGKLYDDDLEDEAGSAQLTPRAFGELLVNHENFNTCMVERVERHVLGTATDRERAELQKTFAETGRMRALFAAALRQYAARKERPAAPAVARTETTAPRRLADGRVELSARLVQLLDDKCTHCHDDATGKLGFLATVTTDRALDSERLVSMASVISSGLMPKNEAITTAEWRGLLEELVHAAAPDSEWEKAALALWTGETFQPSRTHHIGAIASRVAAEAGPGAKQDVNPRQLVDYTLERELLVLSPATVLEMAKMAAKACKHLPPPARQACFKRATQPAVARVD